MAAVEREDPDLVLLDIGLPGIDGIEALKRIRRIAPEVAAIMIKAQGTIETAVEAMRSGAKNYVAKPFNTEEIRLLMRRRPGGVPTPPSGAPPAKRADGKGGPGSHRCRKPGIPARNPHS